jgi:hypothetical protein
MPPKKKPQVTQAPVSPENKLSGMFGWCLIPQHELCPGDAPSIRCSCLCHTEKKVEADEPTATGTDS